MNAHDKVVMKYSDDCLRGVIESLRVMAKYHPWAKNRTEAARRELARREMERKTQDKK